MKKRALAMGIASAVAVSACGEKSVDAVGVDAIGMYGDAFVDSAANRVGSVQVGTHVVALCEQELKDPTYSSIKLKAGNIIGYVAAKNSTVPQLSMNTSMVQKLPAC